MSGHVEEFEWSTVRALKLVLKSALLVPLSVGFSVVMGRSTGGPWLVPLFLR